MADEPESYVVLSCMPENSVTAWSPELKHEIRTLQVEQEDNIGLGDYITSSSTTRGLFEKMDGSVEPKTGIMTGPTGTPYVTFDTSITALPEEFFKKNLRHLEEMAANGSVGLSFELGVVFTMEKASKEMQVGKIYKATVGDHRMLLDSFPESRLQKRLKKQLAKIETIWSVVGELVELTDEAEIDDLEGLINNSSSFDFKFNFDRPSAVLSSSDVLVSRDDENTVSLNPQNSQRSEEVHIIAEPQVTNNHVNNIQDKIDQFCTSFADLSVEQSQQFTASLYQILSNPRVFQALREEMNNPEEADQLYNSLHQMYGC